MAGGCLARRGEARLWVGLGKLPAQGRLLKFITVLFLLKQCFFWRDHPRYVRRSVQAIRRSFVRTLPRPTPFGKAEHAPGHKAGTSAMPAPFLPDFSSDILFALIIQVFWEM